MISMFEILVSIIVQLSPVVLYLEALSCQALVDHLSWFPYDYLNLPKDCNHWNPSTTSTTPIGMESIGLFNIDSAMVSLILWHFLQPYIKFYSFGHRDICKA